MNAMRAALLLLALCMGACHPVVHRVPLEAPAPEPEPEPDPEPEPKPITDLATSLHALGVDSRETPREDGEGNFYPQSYSPFGNSFSMTQMEDGSYVFGRPAKLLFGGFRLKNENATVSVIDNLVIPPGPNLVTPYVIQQRSPSWGREALGKHAPAETKRDATAADVDGDGQEELVFVHVQAGVVHLEVQNGDDDGEGDIDTVLPAPPAVSDLRVRSGDFDRDGRDELVIAMSSPAPAGAAGTATVLIVDDAGTGFAAMRTLQVVGSLVNGSLSLVLVTGSIDYDGADELVVVANEQRGQNTITGIARYFVFDDTDSGFAELASGPVEATVGGVTTVAAVANAAIGDLDNDQAGEILLAGIETMTRTCEAVTHLLIQFDDAVRGLARVAESVSPVARPACSSDAENDPWLVRFVHLNILDLEADGQMEFHVNDIIFPSFPPPGKLWDAIPEAIHMNPTVLFPEQDSDGMFFDRSTNVLAVADVTGDGRDDIVSYRLGMEEIEIFGIGKDDKFVRLLRIAVQTDNPFSGINPIVVPVRANLNGRVTDSETYVYDGAHQLVFTEPLLLAALAAPPCQTGIGQNTDDCTTTWGLSKSTGVESERELKFSVGVGIGREWKAGGWGGEWKAKLMASLARTKSEKYELTKSVSFTTGALEDSVVFSSVPLDTYVYQVISSPNAQRVGEQVTMCLPREAVVRLAERSYYNSHTPEEVYKVGANVFDHVPGEVATYPDKDTKDRLLDDMRSQLENTRLAYNLNLEDRKVFDPVEALLGLETESVGVGQGGGATEVALEVQRSAGEGRAISLGFEFEASVTLKSFKVEVSIGFEAEWTTKVEYGSGTNFVGTVGSIGAEYFAEKQYRFGLFTYIQADPDTGHEFQVVNYWVEE